MGDTRLARKCLAGIGFGAACRRQTTADFPRLPTVSRTLTRALVQPREGSPAQRARPKLRVHAKRTRYKGQQLVLYGVSPSLEGLGRPDGLS